MLSLTFLSSLTSLVSRTQMTCNDKFYVVCLQQFGIVYWSMNRRYYGLAFGHKEKKKLAPR